MTLSLLFLCIALLCLQLVSGTTIQSHGCSEGQSTCLTPGDEYVIHCFVDNGGSLNLLTWVVPGFPDGLSVLYNTDDGVNRGGFMASRVGSAGATGTMNSSLSFTANMSLDEGVIMCRDNRAAQTTESCTLLIDTNPEIVTELSVTSVTYHSVSLSWSPLMDTGGCLFNYIITVIPLNGSSSWEVGTIENVTSYTITGLTFRQSYNFTVRGNNSAGEGDPSDTVNIVLPGEVPNSFDTVDVCLIISSSSNELLINWTFPMVSNDATTPPISDVHITNGSNNLCDVPSPTNNCTTPVVTDNIVYDINITASNIIGKSEPFNIMGSISFEYLSITNVSGSDSVTINCTTTFTCPSMCYCQVQVNNGMIRRGVFTNNEATVTVPDLIPDTQYSYTASLVNGSDVPFAGACIRRMRQFRTLMEPGATTSSVSSSSSTSTIAMSTSTTIVPPSDSMTSTATPTGTTESPSTTTGGNIGVIAGGAAGGGIFLIVVIIIVVVLGVCLYKKKSNTKVDFGGARKSVDSDGPIALVEKGGHPVPETGQALYQEPDTIKREAAPTGDLYAQPDKPRRNAPSKPEESSKELPTYQDPNTIQRTQAPAMDYLYAEVDKKKEQQMYAQVDKERKGGDGTVYADLALSNTGGQAGYPGSGSAVIYSDVNTK